MLNLARTQVMGAYIPDANASEVIGAVCAQQEKEMIDPCPDVPYVGVTTRDELVAAAGDLSEDGFAKIRLDEDIIYNSFNCLKVVKGTVVIDLNGHLIQGSDTVIHACGEDVKVIINDLKGGGCVKGTEENDNYGVLQSKDNAMLVLNAGFITTSFGEHDVLFGLVTYSGGDFQMNGGKMHTKASCIMCSTPGSVISVKSGHLKAEEVVGADIQGQSTLKLYGDAHLEGGIMIDIGHLIIEGDAVVENNGYTWNGEPYPFTVNLGKYASYSETSGLGPDCIQSAVIMRTGMFGNDHHADGLGNDMSVTIAGNAKVSTTNGGPVLQILEVNTAHDQKVDINLRRETYKRYDHDTLDAIYKEKEPSKSLPAETATTDLTIVGGLEK